MLPREEGEDGAGMALLVAVVEVVRARVIEIDGLLQEAEPQDARVKLQVSGCAPGDGGDVMDAGHGVANSCRVGGRCGGSWQGYAPRAPLSVMWSWLPFMTMRSKRPGPCSSDSRARSFAALHRQRMNPDPRVRAG